MLYIFLIINHDIAGVKAVQGLSRKGAGSDLLSPDHSTCCSEPRLLCQGCCKCLGCEMGVARSDQVELVRSRPEPERQNPFRSKGPVVQEDLELKHPLYIPYHK